MTGTTVIRRPARAISLISSMSYSSSSVPNAPEQHC
jgi:hypothetical protein